MPTVNPVHQCYEAWPYPQVPWVGTVRRRQVWQINLDYLFDRCGLEPPPQRPRIWIAGCGTLQSYVFRLANPRAEILATDISAHSLRVAQRRSWWHGQYGIDFEQADLDDPSAYPRGPFDWIECYGVLMNLRDPAATLRHLASRLSPGGGIRLMVYPQFSRQRIFQVQRLAKLCGLSHRFRDHPGILREIMARLSPANPLRFAFDDYSDARCDAGLVDGFLHAGDRGFTGRELGEMIAAAGLRPAFYFHRPWGNPETMAAKLGLEHSDHSFVLHYLDLWQELRTNLIVCLVRADATPPATTPLRPHPLFDLRQSRGLADLLDRLSQRFLGLTLPSRTSAESWRVGSDELRLLRRLARHPDNDRSSCDRLREIGLLLGGSRRPQSSPQLPPQAAWSLPSQPVEPALQIGPQVPNPLYAHLFEAWRFSAEAAPGILPDLATQVERWAPEATALEHNECPFGLTAYQTYQCHRAAIDAHLARNPAEATAGTWQDWHLRDRGAAHARVQAFFAGVRDLPRRDWSEAELTELWVLLFSHRELFLATS